MQSLPGRKITGFAAHQTWENTRAAKPNRIGGGGISNDGRLDKAKGTNAR
jgi:hypothetical protein